MEHKASSLLFIGCILLLLLLFSSSAAAFNITKLLGTFPDFSTLNSLLQQTKLTDQINSRRTITVLAVDNSALSALSGKTSDVIKDVLGAHVILDYYDVEKLTRLGTSNKTTTLTTLFQASGIADGQQGFINVGLVNEGEIAFGSAVKGAAMDSKLVKLVAAQPYNISVLQISAPIAIPGIYSSTPSPSAAPAPSKSPSPPKSSPAPAPPKKAPAPSPSNSSSSSPAPSADAPDADAPASDAPADAPAADGPAADAPAPEAPAADAPKKSGAERSGVAVVVLTVLVSAGFVVSL